MVAVVGSLRLFVFVIYEHRVLRFYLLYLTRNFDITAHTMLSFLSSQHNCWCQRSPCYLGQRQASQVRRDCELEAW
jgi:hypothetical protein